MDADFIQTNHEGDIIDKLHESRGKYDLVILNPEHTQLQHCDRDAVKACSCRVSRCIFRTSRQGRISEQVGDRSRLRRADQRVRREQLYFSSQAAALMLAENKGDIES